MPAELGFPAAPVEPALASPAVSEPLVDAESSPLHASSVDDSSAKATALQDFTNALVISIALRDYSKTNGAPSTTARRSC
jgi:hypothetical protein